jgi:hypothetical protein
MNLPFFLYSSKMYERSANGFELGQMKDLIVTMCIMPLGVKYYI